MSESQIKTKSSPQIINFTPENKTEEDYMQKLNDLLDKKRRGDWEIVAEILGIQSKNSEMAFKRVHSKYHTAVVKTLTEIIEQRINLIKKLS